jgi:hypothetical protein
LFVLSPTNGAVAVIQLLLDNEVTFYRDDHREHYLSSKELVLTCKDAFGIINYEKKFCAQTFEKVKEKLAKAHKIWQFMRHFGLTELAHTVKDKVEILHQFWDQFVVKQLLLHAKSPFANQANIKLTWPEKLKPISKAIDLFRAVTIPSSEEEIQTMCSNLQESDKVQFLQEEKAREDAIDEYLNSASSILEKETQF